MDYNVNDGSLHSNDNSNSCEQLDCNISGEKYNKFICIEDKVETAILNWTIDCPNVPSSSVTNLLHHMAEFIPGTKLTASALSQMKKMS